MGTLGTLAVSIVGDARELDKSLDGVSKKFQTTGKRIGAVGGTLTRNVTGPILAVGAGLVGLATKTGNWADELLDLEAATGINTDRLQQFRAAEVAAGVEADSMADAILRMNRQMVDSDEYNSRVTRSAEGYGVALKDAAGNVRGAEEVTHDLMMAIAAIEDPQERARAGAQAFGRDWEGIAPVIALGADELERLYAQDVVDRDKLEQANEFRQRMDEMKHSLGLAAMELGTKLMPMMLQLAEAIKDNVIPFVMDLVDRIGNLIKWFQDLSPAWQKVIGYAIGFAVVLGPILMVVGKVIAIIGVVLPILKVLGAAILLLTSPIGIVIAVVAGLVFLIVKYWDEIKEFTIKAFNAVKDFLIGLWDGIKEMFGNALAFVKDLFFKYHPLGWIIDNWNEIKDFFVNIWESIKDIFTGSTSGIFDGIKERFTAVKDWLIGIWESVRDWFIGIWGSISGVFDMSLSEIWETIKGWFNSYLDFVSNIMGSIDSTIGNLWNSAKDKVLTAAKAIYDGVKQWFTNLAGSVGGVIRGMVNAVIGLFNSMIGRLNRLSIKIPDWVPGWGGRSFSPNIPSIPTLHKGTDYFIPPGGGREGLALLERGEQVIPAGEGRTVNHTGTIRVEGVNDEGQLVAVKQIILDELYREIRG